MYTQQTNNAQQIAACLATIKHTQPLVHNITNYVVMQLTANALLALGASPIMAHALEEVEEVVKQSQALVINIGTLDEAWLQSMSQALQAAVQYSVPIIVDPVGAGATQFRTRAVFQLLETVAPTVIRGNAAEIMALGNKALPIHCKGVDSSYESEMALEAAQVLTTRYRCTVVISGAEDYIVNHDQCVLIRHGVPLMQQVTGMGCTATAIIAAFCAVEKDYFTAAYHAMTVMGIAGELAMQQVSGPGLFANYFIDALYHMQQTIITIPIQIEHFYS